MSRPEHFGISYANIVYAFLVRVDAFRFEESLHRILGPSSREKKTLIDFLLKKRGSCAEKVFVNEEDGFLQAKEPQLRNAAVPETKLLSSEDLVPWTHIVTGRYQPFFLDELRSTQEMELRWRVSTSDVVSQLTTVRNQFIANILNSCSQQQARDFNSSVSSNGGSCVTLGPVPISLSEILHGNVEAAITDSVTKLCERLLQKCSVWSPTRQSPTSDLHGSNTLAAQWDPNEALIFASVVELVWTLSLSVVLNNHNPSVVFLGGPLQSCRLLFPSTTEAEATYDGQCCSQLSLLSPVFFLTHNIVMRLEAHFQAVLHSGGSNVAPPLRMRYLLLTRSCYELLAQVDEQVVDTCSKGTFSLCASLLKEARLSCGALEDVKWERLLTKVTPSFSSASRQVFAQDLSYIWRWRSGWCERWSGDDKVSAQTTANTGGMPIIISGNLPSFIFPAFQDGAERLLNKCSALKSAESSKGEKQIMHLLSVIYFDTMYLCQIFNNGPGEQSPLGELLSLVKKIMPIAKKDKRLRGVVTLLLSGCLFSQPAVGIATKTEANPEVINPVWELAATLLNDIDAWRKCQNPIWYAVSVASLLGCLSPSAILEKVPAYLRTLKTMFSSADNLDRCSILYSTLHVGGLLVDLHAKAVASSGHSVKSCMECFLHYTEKMLVRDLHSGRWRAGSGAPACIMAASDLLLFVLQQDRFYIKATGWLLNLLDCKNQAKVVEKVKKGSFFCCGQLIAMRTLSALCELKCLAVGTDASDMRNASSNPLFACNLNCGNYGAVDDLYNELTDSKTQIRRRITGVLSFVGSCYNYVVTTVEGPTMFWRGDELRSLLTFIKLTSNIQSTINEIRKAAFEYLQDIPPENLADGVAELKLQLVSVFVVAGFFVPACAMLDRSLALPKLLIDSNASLREAVARVVLPLYLKSGADNNESSYGRRSMCSCAFAIHRLAESIIDVLVSEEDSRVEQLVKYLTAHLLDLKDEMEYIVLKDTYTRKDTEEATNAMLPMFAGAGQVGEVEGKSQRDAVAARCKQWNWLLTPMNKNVEQLEGWTTTPQSESWCVVPALEGTALMDALEGLAVVLLGHPMGSVRRQALIQLDTLASLLSLYRTHCGEQSQASADPLSSAYAHSGVSAGCGNTTVFSAIPRSEQARSQRLTAAEVLKEVGENFEEMYTLLFESYVPFPLERVSSSDGTAGPREYGSFVELQCLSSNVDGDSSPRTPSDNQVQMRADSSGSPLLSTPLGMRCMAVRSEASLSIFVSTVALILATYSYCPGSALVRVVCSLSGEIVQRGLKHFIEGNLQLWKSCYVLNFIILSVDNTKSSPDANRLTQGSEFDRPGHRHGGNTTIVGGFDDSKEAAWRIIKRRGEYTNLMNQITVPLIMHDINNKHSTTFIDLLQFLHMGPIEYTWARDTPLITFPGVMDSEHPIIKNLREVLHKCGNNANRNAEHKASACLSILMLSLITVGRRFFVKPPIIPSRIQEFVAIQRTQMERILVGIVDFLLLGDSRVMETSDSFEERRELSNEALLQMLDEGNGVSPTSWLALPRNILMMLNDDDMRSSFFRGEVGGLKTVIFLRRLFFELVTLIFSKDTKYLEPQLKNKMFLRVFYSLTHQVHWLLAINSLHNGMYPLPTTHPSAAAAMEKGVFALQTLLLSVEQFTNETQTPFLSKIMNSFSGNFLGWLQKCSPVNSANLESDAPSIFNLAVTLLVVDPSSWDAMRQALTEQPIDSSVHRALFSIMVTAFSAVWGQLEEPKISPRETVRSPLFRARSNNSSETQFSAAGSSNREFVNKIIPCNSCLIFFALTYLYEEPTIGPVFCSDVRTKAESFLQLLCGETPSDTSGGDTLDSWFCLVLKATRSSREDDDTSNRLVQTLFAMASNNIITAESKTSSSAPLQRGSVKIALKLLSLFIRQVEATETSIRELLNVTQMCRNTVSDYYIAEVWGRWIAYEGYERERFITVLVTSTIDISEKNIVAHYIDKYISKESPTQNTREDNGSLSSRLQGAYYSFLLFSLYQMRILNKCSSNSPSSSTKCDMPLGDNFSDAFTDDRVQHSFAGVFSHHVRNNGSIQSKCHVTNSVGKGRTTWIAEENIWRGLLRPSLELFRSRCFSTSRRDKGLEDKRPSVALLHDDTEASLEMNFVKPLVSVLFFASWSIERLQHHGQRLWKEIYRDLATLNNFSVNVESGEAKPADNQIPLYYGSYDERNIAEEVDAVVVPGDDEERPSQSAERQNDADDESGSDCNTVVKHSGRESFASEEQAQMEASKVLSDKSVVDRGSVVEHSDTSSNATVVHGKSVTPAADEGVTVCPESVKQQETNKKKKRGPTNDKNDVYRIVHRDYLTLHIHFSCMLLAHLCSGMQQFPGQQDELDSRFYVINLAFRVLYKLLTGTVVDRTYGAPTATKYWLNLTLTRLKHRSSMSAQDRSRTHRMLDCWDALLLEESLVFEGTKVSENYADCPASAVDIVFSELFMGIAGNGRSVNGRRFLQRCLHNSSKWLTRGFMMEDRGWSRKHQVHSHISLLCMKVVRAISSCLSLSTKTLIVECNWRQLWMEKMTMQLTEANLLRDLISVLCNRVKSYHTTSLCRNNQPVVGAKYVSCIPVLTTLGCLLRDIVTHEIFYSSEPQGQGKGEMKPEMLALTTPFGSNSPFPSTYLLVCFWSAFAFLLTYNAWAVACDLLTVFHRYGCLRLLEVIPKPSFCTLGNFQLIVRPECAAVQLALLQQGRITAMQKKDNGVLRSTIGRDYRHNTMVVLTYLDEFTKDNDCGAAILAFTELVILCDWVSLNLTGLCQEARRTTPDKETQGAGDSADASTRGRAESNGPAVYSLSEYLRHFGEKWKQSMVMFSGGAGSSFQNLSLRMRYVLDEMFQVCLKVFNIPSLDVMLNTVVIAKKDEKQSDSPLSYSPADNLDLCSLHSRSEMEGERCDLYDDSVLSFQHYFEILVMVPFMSLFQWTATSFPLWSKILSLISALFWYHEQEYSYITNLLLKILPDLEAALNDTVLQNTLEDVSDVYLGDRLMISVLTEGVLAKVESLKSYRSPMPSYYSDKATYRPTPLVSLIEDEKLINDIMKHLMDFLTPKMAPSTGNGNHLSVMSLMGDFPSRGREKTASRRRLVKETVEDDARSAKSTHAESKCTPPRATVRFSTDGDAEEGSSSSHSDVEEEHRKHQTQHEVTCSHRFGEFFYEVYDEASLAPGPIYQVPVEYYYCMPQERLPSTSPDGEEDVASGFSDFMEFHGSEARTRSVGNADISSHDPDSLNTSLTTSEADVFSRKS